MKIHIVQKGDTLWKLAEKYNVNYEQLKSVNSQLSNPDTIMPGMKVKVPTGSVPVKKEVAKKKEAPMTPKQPIKKEVPLKKEEVKMPPTAPQPITTNQQMQKFNMNVNVVKNQHPTPPPYPSMPMPHIPEPPKAPKKPKKHPEPPKEEKVKPTQPKKGEVKKPKLPKMPAMKPTPPACPPMHSMALSPYPVHQLVPISGVMPGCGYPPAGSQMMPQASPSYYPYTYPSYMPMPYPAYSPTGHQGMPTSPQPFYPQQMQLYPANPMMRHGQQAYYQSPYGQNVYAYGQQAYNPYGFSAVQQPYENKVSSGSNPKSVQREEQLGNYANFNEKDDYED